MKSVLSHVIVFRFTVTKIVVTEQSKMSGRGLQQFLQTLTTEKKQHKNART